MPEASRRGVLQAMGQAMGLAAADVLMAEEIHRHVSPQAAAPRRAGDYRPKFFVGREMETVFRLTDMILPSDGTPGARDAGVAEFLDYYLGHSPDAAKATFRQGLRWIDGNSRSKFGKPFVDAAPDQQTALLTLVSSSSNSDPGDLAGITFFQSLRNLTVFAFYTSKIGIQELGYIGNTFTTEFPGACTHNHEL